MVRKDKYSPWTRGIIVDIPANPEHPKAHFRIRAIDYGDVFSVVRENILRYPDSIRTGYTDIPALALSCSLVGLAPRLNIKTPDVRKKEMLTLLRIVDRYNSLRFPYENSAFLKRFSRV